MLNHQFELVVGHQDLEHLEQMEALQKNVSSLLGRVLHTCVHNALKYFSYQHACTWT